MDGGETETERERAVVAERGREKKERGATDTEAGSIQESERNSCIFRRGRARRSAAARPPRWSTCAWASFPATSASARPAPPRPRARRARASSPRATGVARALAPPARRRCLAASSIREQWTVGKGAPQCNDSPTGCFLLVPLWSRSRAETSYKKLLVIFRLKKTGKLSPPLNRKKQGGGGK